MAGQPSERIDSEDVPAPPKALRLERRAILVGALPVAAAAGGGVLVSILSAAVIGRYGTLSLAGVSLGGVIAVVVAAPTTGVFAAHQVRVARMHGAALNGTAVRLTQRVAGTGAAVLAGLAVVVIAVGLMCLGTTSGVWHEALRYLLGRAASLPAAFVAALYANHLYVIGQRRAPVILLLVNSAVLLPLSVVLIYVCNLGALGDGLAGSIAAVVTLLVLARAFRLNTTTEDVADAEAVYSDRFSESSGTKFMPFAAPLMLSNSLDQLGTLTVSAIVAASSVSATAALRVGINLQSVLFIVLNAVSVAAITVVASQASLEQSRSRKIRGTLARVHLDGAVAACVVALAVLGAFAVLGTDDADVRRDLIAVAAATVICVPACAVTFACVSQLRIAGRTGADAKANVIAVWAVLVPAAAILAWVGPPAGVVLAYVAYWVARALMCWRAVRTPPGDSVDASPDGSDAELSQDESAGGDVDGNLQPRAQKAEQ